MEPPTAANNYRAGAGSGPRILISNTECFVRSGTEFQTNASLTNARQMSVSDTQALGLDQAKPLLFQFAPERRYLALEPSFPFRNGRIRRHRLPESIQTVRHSNRLMWCSEAQFIFHFLTNPSLPTAIDSDQRSSRRSMSPLHPASAHSR
jgi:hypothetical protein